MNAQTLRPYALLTLSENDEVTLKLAEAYALADVLNSSIQGGNDGPNFENLSWISGMIFERLGNIEDLMKVGRERESEAHMVKAPAPPSQEAPEETDPLKKGKAVIALFRSNYDLLNSVISKSPEIKNQLRELQGEAAELMEKFDDLLIDLDDGPKKSEAA